MEAFSFLVPLLEVPVCIGVLFCFTVVMKFAVIVAVIIDDDIVDDCFLIMILWRLDIGLYAVFSLSPAPPTPS